MKIDEETLNSSINYCIDEYVRLEEERAILRERWFKGMSIKELADAHKKSETCIKELFRTTGAKILLRASKIR